MTRCHPLALARLSVEPTEIRRGGATGSVGSFGMTRLNDDGTPKMHRGIDLLSHTGALVYAAHNGRIRRAGWQDVKDHAAGYGQRIYLAATMHDLETRYAHLSEISVELGSLVRVGQVIGKVGRTGNVSEGVLTHLHFEVWTDSEAINPVSWLVREEHVA